MPEYDERSRHQTKYLSNNKLAREHAVEKSDIPLIVQVGQSDDRPHRGPRGEDSLAI